eukprot:Gb_05271 [translate_table: standard]
MDNDVTPILDKVASHREEGKSIININDWAFIAKDLTVAGMDTSATTLELALSELKYLQCVVKETLGLHPPGALMLPHESTEACIVGGYHIPGKARLVVNVWAIGRNPSVWEDPLAFKPERFMGRDIDVRGDPAELNMNEVFRLMTPRMFELYALPVSRVHVEHVNIFVKNALSHICVRYCLRRNQLSLDEWSILSLGSER